MMFLKNYYVNSSNRVDIHVITHDVKRAIRESGVANGLVTVLIPGATAGVVLLENDPKLHQEYRDWVLAQVPASIGARPQRPSGTGRNSAHLQAALVGLQLSLPVQQGALKIGPWQEVILLDFDDKVGRREISIQVLDAEFDGGD